VSFDIRRGERVGLIGPNGAGKSTLFSILSEIYGPSEGHVEIHGRLQALIALGAGFHPLLTGRENIYVNAAILGMNRKAVDRIQEEIIAFADLGEFIDAPVKNYSSGMLVRLGFAIAANMNPDIMLIDEILAVGDARFQSKCIGFSKRLADEGRTVVMVSHNLNQVLRVCERAIWLDHGCILMDGPARDVVREYSTWALREGGGAAAAGRREVAGSVIRFTYETVAEPHPDAPVKMIEGNGLPVVIRGTTLRLVLRYELLEPIHGKLEFWAHVKDAVADVRIFGTSNAFHGALIDAKPGDKGKVVFEFPDIPLMDGPYCWDVGVSDLGEYGQTGSLAYVLETQPSFHAVSSKKDFRSPYYVSTQREPLLEWPSRVTVSEGA
jgi:lipopolysaccharide transport system ATP-binding protein